MTSRLLPRLVLDPLIYRDTCLDPFENNGKSADRDQGTENERFATANKGLMCPLFARLLSQIPPSSLSFSLFAYSYSTQITDRVVCDILLFTSTSSICFLPPLTINQQPPLPSVSTQGGEEESEVGDET